MGSQDQTLVVVICLIVAMLSYAVSFACLAVVSAHVSEVGSPEWQAWKQAELNYLAPSVGPSAAQGITHAQVLLNHEQQNLIHTAKAPEFVAGRRKRQVQVEGSPEWQAYKNAELAFIAPSVGPTPLNYAQAQLDFVGPAPGPTPVNFAQAQLNYQQEALNFIASGAGRK